MKRIRFIVFLITYTLLSCNTNLQSNEDGYDENTKKFKPEVGNFTINFPSKPDLKVIDNQIGTDKYKIYYYQATETPEKLYSVEFIKIPEYLFEINYKSDDAYNKTLKGLEMKYDGLFKLTMEKPVKKGNVRGCYYEFSLNVNAPNKPKGLNGVIKGILFYTNNCSYNVAYHGIEQNNIQEFLDSFQFVK